MHFFSEQEDKNKKMADGEGEISLPATQAASSLWYFPESCQSLLPLALCATSDLSLLCGAAELWLCPSVIPTVIACHEYRFPPALSAGLSKTLMYIYCSGALRNPWCYPSWSLVITWDLAVVRQTIGPWPLPYCHWNGGRFLLCRRWPL